MDIEWWFELIEDMLTSTDKPSNSMAEYLNSSRPEPPFYSGFIEFRLGVGIWEILLFLFGVPMNLIVIYLARRIVKKMNNQIENQQLCIFSMAVADLLFTSVHCPMMFVNFALSIHYGIIPCKILYFFTHLSTVASSLSLLNLNVDKFVSLRWPLRYRSILTYRRTKVCLLVSWILSLAWALFFIFGPLTAFESGCQVYTIAPHAYAVFFALYFVLPILSSLAISLYIMSLTVEARRAEARAMRASLEHIARGRTATNESLLLQQQQQKQNGSRHNSRTTSEALSDLPMLPNRRRVSTVKTVTFVFSTTLWSSLTFIPYRVAYIFYHFTMNDTLARVSFGLFALMISNAAGNPFITVLTQHQYRARIKRLLKRRSGGLGADSGASGSDDTTSQRQAISMRSAETKDDDGEDDHEMRRKDDEIC